MNLLTIRPYISSDKQAALKLYYNCVHRLDAYYSPEELNAWAPDDNTNYEWMDELPTLYSYVAEINGQFVGFGAMRSDGEIHVVFVNSEYQRQGIGKALLKLMVQIAKGLGLSRLYLEAGINAVPFYAAFGFTADYEQLREYRGHHFLLTTMSMSLNS